MNKLAVALVLCGVAVGVASPHILKVSASPERSPVTSMTSREFEKATVDAMEINRQMFAQQKAEDEKREHEQAKPVSVAPEAAPVTQADPNRSNQWYQIAKRQVERCDQDWMPSTCAKMRADFKAEYGWDL